LKEGTVSKRAKLIARIDHYLECWPDLVLGETKSLIDDCRAALSAEQGAQPVAWMYVDTHNQHHRPVFLEHQWPEAELTGGWVVTPLYEQPAPDAPPQTPSTADDGLLEELRSAKYLHAGQKNPWTGDMVLINPELRRQLIDHLLCQPSASPAPAADDALIADINVPCPKCGYNPFASYATSSLDLAAISRQPSAAPCCERWEDCDRPCAPLVMHWREAYRSLASDVEANLQPSASPAQTAGDSIERAEAALSAIADIYNDYFNDACVRHNAAVDAAQTAGEGSEQDVARWAHILQHTTVIECAGWHWERKWDGPLQEVVDLSREVTFIDRARNQEKSK